MTAETPKLPPMGDPDKPSKDYAAPPAPAPDKTAAVRLPKDPPYVYIHHACGGNPGLALSEYPPPDRPIEMYLIPPRAEHDYLECAYCGQRIYTLFRHNIREMATAEA